MALTDLTELTRNIKAWGRALGFADIRIADAYLPDAEAGLQAWLNAGRHGAMAYMAKHGMLRARPTELVPGTRRVIVARMDYLPRGSFDITTGDRPALACSARSAMQGRTVSQADSMLPEFPATLPTLSPRERERMADEKSEDFSGRDNKQHWRKREQARLQDPMAAAVSVYARGRDYHRALRSRLQQLADRITEAVGPFTYRVFTDSAPVMEVALASQSGLGWRGKHTLLLQHDAGSMFFLGEILVDLPLPLDVLEDEHCGRCRACIDICPTQAIIAPYELDARRCISYLTIEHPGSIPEALRPLMGNHVYGCDDCQLICPWNRFAKTAVVPDFDVRNGLDRSTLIDLFSWNETDFEQRLEGSPIRRIGHERWLRNIAVALGNAMRHVGNDDDVARIKMALQMRADHPSELVREHVLWALAQQQN